MSDTDVSKISTDTYSGPDRRDLWHRMLIDGARGVGIITLLGTAFWAGQFVADARIPSKSAQIAMQTSRANSVAIRHIQGQIQHWDLDARLARIETTQALILDELRDIRANKAIR